MNDNFTNNLPSGQLSNDVDQLFRDFDYLDILKNYGSCCLFINSLLCRTLNKISNQGYNAKLISCYAKLENSDQIYLLGHPDYIDPGQLAGHICCLVNEQYVIDFGLGNLRKFDPHFVQAIASPVAQHPQFIAHVTTAPQQSLTWVGDHIMPNLEAAIQLQENKLIQVLAFLEHFQSDRLGHCVRKALTPKRRRSAVNKPSTQAVNWPLQNFDDTLRP